jgi:hypothetical protein
MRITAPFSTCLSTLLSRLRSRPNSVKSSWFIISLFLKARKLGYRNVVRWLLQKGLVDVSIHGFEGFRMAAIYTHPDPVDTLLQNGGNINKRSPLYSAIATGNIYIMKDMIDCGAKVIKDIRDTCESSLSNKWCEELCREERKCHDDLT